MKINSKAAGGFTLVELLVAITIIAIPAARVFLAANRARQRARAAQRRQNLHQLGIGLQLFTSETSTYPLLINPGYAKGASAYPEHHLGWEDAIQHQLSKLGVRYDTKSGYPPLGIWHCPAAYFPSSFEPDQP